MVAVGKAHGAINGAATKKHGGATNGKLSKTYISWRNMKQRCTDPGSTQFKWYGGRGITVCDAWINDYGKFLADMGERPEGMTLDRIDPDGDYEPANCRWANSSDQRRNRSNAH